MESVIVPDEPDKWNAVTVEKVRVAMSIAVMSFGGQSESQNDGKFNGAGFGVALNSLCGVNGGIDGNLVSAILCGRKDVEMLAGGSHYRFLADINTERLIPPYEG